MREERSHKREAILVIETIVVVENSPLPSLPGRAIALFEALQRSSRANSWDLAGLPEKQKRR